MDFLRSLSPFRFVLIRVGSCTGTDAIWGFLQSALYLPFQGWVGNTIGYNLFTTRDAQYHSALKQPVASAYGLKSALELEPIVTDCITTFVRRLDEEMVQSKGEKACDLAAWLQHCQHHVDQIDYTRS
ncbi:hypothetical protein DL764_001563 [Monosporascus ibericus]|uniref:Uncharacterized protein n=1 Tax=Monosporascus ibericus TaxID=155417 RepID=A0A4Q4TQM9_9PEZI|nr:hypothetical protein DL764_001563 [Monosporascus ibericus]